MSRYEREKRKYHPTATTIISGSNCRHLNSPHTEYLLSFTNERSGPSPTRLEIGPGQRGRGIAREGGRCGYNASRFRYGPGRKITKWRLPRVDDYLQRPTSSSAKRTLWRAA